MVDLLKPCDLYRYSSHEKRDTLTHMIFSGFGLGRLEEAIATEKLPQGDVLKVGESQRGRR